MANREIGLMGYVGESVVEQWLRTIYPSAEIVAQIKPSNVAAKGGPYLDFGVIQDGVVTSIYEVKSQDYIPDKNFSINIALKYLWDYPNQAHKFTTQQGNEYQGNESTQSFLIFLVAPNDDFIRKIGKENCKKIILFSDIWKKIDSDFCFDKIIDVIRTDIERVLSILHEPKNGRQIIQEFIKYRQGV